MQPASLGTKGYHSIPGQRAISAGEVGAAPIDLDPDPVGVPLVAMLVSIPYVVLATTIQVGDRVQTD